MKNQLKIKVISVNFFVLLLLPLFAMAQDQENYTHKLTQSTSNYEFWTTPPSERVFKNDALPEDIGSEVKAYAAKNESEPFLVVVKPKSSGSVTINIGEFGSGITTEIYQVKYVNISQATDSLGKTGDYPDPLWPVEKGDSVTLASGQNTAFWFNVYVPKTASKGDYTANVQISGISIPVKLHVFNFAIPDELHVKSQMNFDHNAVLTKYGVSVTGDDYWMYVDKMKQFFIDHRLTPKSPLWPGGVTTSGASNYVAYDCNGTLTDDEPEWQFEGPAEKYLDGNHLNNGVGFPSFMAATFQNNDASADQRPSTFCGQTRGPGDWYTGNNPSSAYNQKWFQYITSLQNYLSGLGYLDKAYFYFANEPQDQADYDAVAWYSQELKKAAPNLKLMVSEEPKPEIYNHSTYTGSKIDIWLPVLNQYEPDVSHDREKNYGEETWIYFLHGTRPPYFNPITLDHPGIESKLTGWFLWKYRIRGIAYYSLNSWSKNPWTDPMTANHNGDLFMLYPPSVSNNNISYGSNHHRFVPSIRFELMRDSLEDYEYLHVLKNGQPVVDQTNTADAHVDKIVSGLTSYTRDSEFMYNLRRFIGLKNGGEISSIPDIHPQSGNQGTPGNYYINFQNPDGEPTANPLVVNGKTYMKIGWDDYDETRGYGWYSPNDANWMSQYLPNGPNELQKSIIYSDWGRPAIFEFDLPNGTYDVTVSVGWDNREYLHHKIEIENISFIDDEATTASDSYIVRTKEVTVSDGKLTMAMGIFDKYTILNYLDIEAVGGVIVPECTESDWQYTDGQCQSNSTLTRTWTKNGPV